MHDAYCLHNYETLWPRAIPCTTHGIVDPAERQDPGWQKEYDWNTTGCLCQRRTYTEPPPYSGMGKGGLSVNLSNDFNSLHASPEIASRASRPKRPCHATHQQRSTGLKNATLPAQTPRDQNAKTPNIRPTSMQHNMMAQLQQALQTILIPKHRPLCFTYLGSCSVRYNPKERRRSPRGLSAGSPPQAVLRRAARAVAESEAWRRRLILFVSKWELLPMRCWVGGDECSPSPAAAATETILADRGSALNLDALVTAGWIDG